MENVDKRKDVKIVKDWESGGNRLRLRALTVKPNFQRRTEFIESLTEFQLGRMNFFYNKPINLGFSVLEILKWKMYDFHYGYMKPKYQDDISFCCLDADSFSYSMRTDDFYDDILADIDHRFGTFDYELENRYGILLRIKQVVRMFKDEASGETVKRSEMYCYKRTPIMRRESISG